MSLPPCTANYVFILAFLPTVRFSLGYDMSSVCLCVVCNARIVAKRCVVEIGDGTVE